MLRNYFKTAWRNLTKTIGYSTLNILGLAIGMSVALVIGLWVYEQYSFDRFLPQYESLYRVQRNFDSNGDTLTFRTTSLKLAQVLREDVPEVEYVAESDWMGPHGLMVGDKKIYVNGGISGNDFLKMFKYPFVEGNAQTALKDAYSIVLTQSTAKALFGNEQAMNKMVRFDNQHDLKVTGILKDLPKNSSISFNFIVPFSYIDQAYPGELNRNSFGNNSLQIFVKLKPGIRYNQLASKIRNIEHTEKDNINAMNSYVTLQPIERWHLYSKYVNGKDTAGFLVYVRMFTIIGILVLLIACINFINLTTARSVKRAKEVGVRKAIGSGRRDLIFQFLLESFLLTLISFLLVLLLAQITLPAFNTLFGSTIQIPYNNLYFWLVMVGSLVFVSLVSGSRPAFYLSSFQPVKVLKGTLKVGKSSSYSRKILVVLQFTCSVALIISTIIIYRQIQFAKSRPTGYDLNKLLTTDMNADLRKNFTALKNELIQKGIVAYVTSATSPSTDVWWHTDIEYWPGKHPGETVEMGNILVSEDYFKTLGMAIVDGRNFTGGYDSTGVIFNETAVKRLRLVNPVNQKIRFDDKEYTIVGVVKDALMISPFKAAEPTMFRCFPEAQNLMMYKLSSKVPIQKAISELSTLFNKYNPAYPYDYSFADENYASKLNLELMVGKLSGLFSGLAIFISCLGLFGLAAFMAEQRTKEIGIRKVLGASVRQIWLLLSRDFILLVVISCLLASPLTFYFLENWLENYDYRIQIGPWVFLLGAFIALIITIATISFQSVKTALSDPVKSLRSE